MEATDCWRAPTGFDPGEAATQGWLALGGWIAYRAASPCCESPDLFSMTPAQAVGWATENGIAAAIQSFHDDQDWRVVVGAGEQENGADGRRPV